MKVKFRTYTKKDGSPEYGLYEMLQYLDGNTKKDFVIRMDYDKKNEHSLDEVDLFCPSLKLSKLKLNKIDDSTFEAEFKVNNPRLMFKFLINLGNIGNCGHSFSVRIADKDFSFDGDGADNVVSINDRKVDNKLFNDTYEWVKVYNKEFKTEDMKQTIDEKTIRQMVSESVKALLENYADEYRTKGALGKKTLEKNAGKSAEEIIADRQAKAEEDERASKWAETQDDILAKFDKGEEYDDSKAGGDYSIDYSDPYFFTKDGERVDADAIGNFHNDFAIVKKDGKCNFIDSEGKILSDEWFDACNDFESGFGLVVKGKQKNFVGSNGKLLLDFWVDRAGDFLGSRAPIIFNGERHEVDHAGTIY